MNYIYPKSEFTNGVYIPHKISHEKIENVKNLLKKITNQNPQIIFQTEYIYRDQAFITIITNNITTEMYCKKRINAEFNNITKNLHITYELTPIEKYNFPVLNTYHHVDNKEIHKYKNILLIKIDDTNWNICIEYQKKQSIDQLLEKITKII